MLTHRDDQLASSADGVPSPEVLFVPFYYYLSYDAFRRVILALIASGTPARILRMHFNAHDERGTFDDERFRRDGIPFARLDLDLRGIGMPGIGAKANKVRAFWRNRARIREYLRTNRPGLVVVESDLGGLYVRALLEECVSEAIPPAVLMTVDVGQAVSSRFDTSTLQRFVNRASRLVPALRPLLHRSEVAGAYALGAPVLVPSEAMRRRLASGGIEASRIRVMGSPHHDAIFELRARDRSAVVARLFRAGGIPAGSQLVVLCTEVIEEVFGQQYIREVYPRLARAFARLPGRCRVALRFHPRESPDNLAFYRSCYTGDRYVDLTDQPLDDVLYAADLCVGHFSSVLLKALSLRAPVLTINLRQSATAAMFEADELLPQMRDEGQLSKIPRTFTDPSFGAALRAFVERWCAAHLPSVDGSRALSIARELSRLISADRV
jgi:hypothetical protein